MSAGAPPRATAAHDIDATELRDSFRVISRGPEVSVSVVFDYGSAPQALTALARAVESVRDQIAQTA